MPRISDRYNQRLRSRRPMSWHRSKKLNRRQKRQVRSIVTRRMETKYSTGYVSAFNVSSTPGLYDLTGTATANGAWNITQGAGRAQRIGDEITLKRMVCRIAALGGDYYQTMRIILFRWNGSNATAPTAADILDGTGEEWVLATYNYDYRHKYKIMYDRVFSLVQTNSFTSTGSVSSNVVNTSASYKVFRPFTLYGKRLGKMHVSWDAGSASAGEDHIYLMVVSDSIIAPSPQLFFTSTLFYTDS